VELTSKKDKVFIEMEIKEEVRVLFRRMERKK
jgi:hypothetical protein